MTLKRSANLLTLKSPTLNAKRWQSKILQITSNAFLSGPPERVPSCDKEDWNRNLGKVHNNPLNFGKILNYSCRRRFARTSSRRLRRPCMREFADRATRKWRFLTAREWNDMATTTRRGLSTAMVPQLLPHTPLTAMVLLLLLFYLPSLVRPMT